MSTGRNLLILLYSVDLGFPEFESIHSIDFSIEAQFSKSVASTIPPRPPNHVLKDEQPGLYILQMNLQY